MRPAQIPLAKIVVETELQPRLMLDEWVAEEYAEAMRAGAQFPPLTVFFDGDCYWLADGFHRYYAYGLIGASTVPVEVRSGSRRDALLHSCGANAQHGLRRSNGDKRRAVERLLADEEWQRWASRHIANACAVSHGFVDKMRRELSRNGRIPADLSAPRLSRRGNTVYLQRPRPRGGQWSERRRASETRRRRPAAKAETGEDAAETLRLRQQRVARALEIISGIAEHCPAESFPVSDDMRTHLAPAREWLKRLRE